MIFFGLDQDFFHLLQIVNSGSLLEDFSPPVNPPKEIDDPEDSMPEDWDEREKIPDPDATKPDDWDEDAPFRISDPDAVKPDGWLDEEPEMIPDPTSQKPDDWYVCYIGNNQTLPPLSVKTTTTLFSDIVHYCSAAPCLVKVW